jgi:hypothetical protein
MISIQPTQFWLGEAVAQVIKHPLGARAKSCRVADRLPTLFVRWAVGQPVRVAAGVALLH